MINSVINVSINSDEENVSLSSNTYNKVIPNSIMNNADSGNNHINTTIWVIAGISGI